MKDILCRRLLSGSLVFYDAAYGLVVGEHQIFINGICARLASDKIVYLVDKPNEQEQIICKNLQVKYNEYLQGTVQSKKKALEEHNKVVDACERGSVVLLNGFYYLYLGKVVYTILDKEYKGHTYIRLESMYEYELAELIKHSKDTKDYVLGCICTVRVKDYYANPILDKVLIATRSKSSKVDKIYCKYDLSKMTEINVDMIINCQNTMLKIKLI